MVTKTQFLTVLLSAVLAGFGGGFLAGFIGHVDPASAVQMRGVPAVLEAGEFRLVDIEGRVRAVLGFRSALEPELRVLDLNGNKRVSLGTRNNGYGGIWMYDKQGDLPAVSVVTMEQGPSSLMFYDNGVPRAELGNELGFRELGFKPEDASAPTALKFWKGGAYTGTLHWHAP